MSEKDDGWEVAVDVVHQAVVVSIDFDGMSLDWSLDVGNTEALVRGLRKAVESLRGDR